MGGFPVGQFVSSPGGQSCRLTFVSSLFPDQYVLPGNIIYKQRGTVWHPGENTIMGRDHTIHAAVAGYVKYYRDPHRHPDHQYIGVAFNRDDKLPYPPGSPRKRKLNLVAVPQKKEKRSEEVISPSGIPLTVTRLPESEQLTESEDSTTTGVSVTAQTTVAAKPKLPIHLKRRIPLKDGNSVIARLIQQKLRARVITKAKQDARRLQQQKELEARMNTRVFRLQDDYSYRETNWEIGRLIGDAGTIPGTEKTESRRARMRSRRKKRAAYFRELKARRVAKARRREESKRRLREKRALLLAQRREAAATVKAANEAAKAAAEKNKVKA